VLVLEQTLEVVPVAGGVLVEQVHELVVLEYGSDELLTQALLSLLSVGQQYLVR